VGIAASDVLVNGRPANSISGGGREWSFHFDRPPYGNVSVTWDAGLEISDLASPPNRFVPESNVIATYQLIDETDPQILRVSPAPSFTVRDASVVEVVFTEPVTGIDADDLRINQTRASAVTGSGSGPYLFTLPPVNAGQVLAEFQPNHAITDLQGNPFAGANWTFRVDPNFVFPSLRLNEFLAASAGGGGLLDEDDDASDWIEIYNPTPAAVNLVGWALSDEEDDLGKWVFPETLIQPNGHVVVFASGKDRKPASGNLHTNFKLSDAGEYLALSPPGAPRQPVSVFKDYPEQRVEISYGYDADGNLRHFASPTPGTTNGASSIAGVAPPPRFNVPRGVYDQGITLQITNTLLGAQIRYTMDGSEPTASSGLIYNSPLVLSSNGVIRAAAFKPNYLPSRVETHTYVFPAVVAKQPSNPPGFPQTWIDTAGRTWAAYYEMDPEIVNSPTYTNRIVGSLKSLPVISIVTAPRDMFDNSTGIYPKSQARGPQWERPASAEFIFPGQGESIQVDCGVQMQGNSVRDPVKTAKHSFRLVFKGDYGATKLRHQLFTESPLKEFDTITLRADFNNSWLHWDGSQRLRGQRVRDAFFKDSQRAMSGLGAHNRFFHLYVNGLYWGVYDPTERPDAAFGAAYLGGSKADYDVVNEGQLVDGNMNAYNAMIALSNLADNGQFQQMQQYLDVTHYIDYILLHFYAGHEDWGLNKNWYTLRKRAAGEGFKYIAWDGEMILNSPTQNRVSSSDTASGLHTKLVANAEYRLRFADRAHKHLFNGGALTPPAVSARYQARATEVDLAMVAESARWGDYRRDVHQYSSAPYLLYTRDDHFVTERNRLLTQYFPARTATVLSQLRAAGLYPTIVAPALSKHGGHAKAGEQITLSAPAGTIYYTTNGSDPRVAFSGEVSATARVYASPLTITNDTVVKARVRSGDAWSALAEATFTTGALLPKLAITEVMYNPPDGSPYEFIELHNFGSIPLDIGGFSLEGVTFTFPFGTTLEAGAVLVIASGSSPSAFASRYPNVRVGGYFEDSLSNGGERIAVVDRNFNR
ncbi:MAG TPA: lamin tail domain-containing protein, partial [Methylomirabilota bacterium]|nr:lamin tail domain-containing protein [Methylomirabilota bacterium]